MFFLFAMSLKKEIAEESQDNKHDEPISNEESITDENTKKEIFNQKVTKLNHFLLIMVFILMLLTNVLIWFSIAY
jgi:hypothetical protein